MNRFLLFFLLLLVVSPDVFAQQTEPLVVENAWPEAGSKMLHLRKCKSSFSKGRWVMEGATIYYFTEQNPTGTYASYLFSTSKGLYVAPYSQQIDSIYRKGAYVKYPVRVLDTAVYVAFDSITAFGFRNDLGNKMETAGFAVILGVSGAVALLVEGLILHSEMTSEDKRLLTGLIAGTAAMGTIGGIRMRQLKKIKVWSMETHELH